MTASLAHRGPDAEGYYFDERIGLGHRRLSIIDLQDRANQPMASSCGRYQVIYNGEIYNFKQLRTQLESKGLQFRTSSDTEVLIEGFKLLGKDFLQRVNGMFAFAVWDLVEKSLFLARDRLGEKPLYYCELENGDFAFASEPRALYELPTFSRKLSPLGLSQYLSLNYTLTSACIFKNLRKLPPAHYLTVSPSRPVQVECYWDLAPHFLSKRTDSESQLKEEFLALLDDAVRLRLVSDVPLGAFLSGGIDSSAIVASMAQSLEKDAIQTYSVGFSEPSFSESDFASATAKYLGVTHHDQTIREESTKVLSRLLNVVGEPFADTSMLPMYYLAEHARRSVKVCLSGDGGDELLAGYSTYLADRLNTVVGKVPGPVLNTLDGLMGLLLPVQHEKVGFDYKVRAFLRGASSNPMHAHYRWREIFSKDEFAALVDPEAVKGILSEDPALEFKCYERDVAEASIIDRALYVDTKTWLANDILLKVDRSTMLHGLEARPPFLDHRLVEFCASLPVNLKLRGTTQKYLLKRSQGSRLPASILSRKKSGFNAPIAHWLSGGLRTHLHGMVSGAHPVFRSDLVKRLLTQHEERKADNSFKLFTLINFDIWAKEAKVY